MKRLLLALSRSSVAERIATTSRLAAPVTRRFVAGTTVADAVAARDALAADGLLTTLDLLGEEVTSREDAQAAARTYVALLDALAGAGEKPAVSVKPTQMGLRIDRDLAEQHIDLLATHPSTPRITLDMEDHTTTDDTIALAITMRERSRDVGCAIQAALHRSRADVRDLSERGISVRLCKGAYAEPDTIASTSRAKIQRRFVDLADTVLTSGVYGRFASHDDVVLDQIVGLINRRSIAEDAYEFQMLHGVRPDKARALAAAGHRVRIYVPFGGQWYPYLMRRMAERPANLALFLRALTSKK